MFSIGIDHGFPQPDHRHYTYADDSSWPDDVRYELINGVAFLMSPASTLDHQDVVGEIYRQLANTLEGQPGRAYVSPVDVRVPRADEDDADIDTVVQPDVLVICDRAKTDRRGVRGGPDFVVEVLSHGTASHDHVRKRRVYARGGVREYRLVHPVDRTLTVYRLEQGRFGGAEVTELAGETPVGILPGVVIAWDALVGRLALPKD